MLILAFFFGRSKGYISMIMVDGLHSVDLGTGAHIVGNICGTWAPRTWVTTSRSWIGRCVLGTKSTTRTFRT